jgi:hypothetical protein
MSIYEHKKLVIFAVNLINMKKFLIFIFTTSILLFSQCKKYPEGPSFSLRTKTERISNTWKLNQLLVNNVDSTAQYSSILKDYTVIINKSGSYSISYYVSLPPFGNFTNTENGNWSFSSNKKEINLTPVSITLGTLPAANSWQILKLYEKELWLKDIDNNGKITELHLLPK